MSEVLTAAQMRAIEAAAIASGAVTGLELMERAGAGVVAAVLEEWPEMALTPQRAVVLCGPGNNGGDGFVVARLLAARGWAVEVYLYGDAGKLPPDARVNYERWMEVGEVKPMGHSYGSCDLVVDAVFGVGISRPIDDPILWEVLWQVDDVCDVWDGHDQYVFPNASSTQHGKAPRTVAVDIPSGLHADTGEVVGSRPDHGRRAPRVMLTVTFQAEKLGHILGEGELLCGKVVVVDLRIEQRALASSVQLTIPPRNADLAKWGGQHHKFSHGHALIVSGDHGHAGAARMSARAALRIGAGLVTVASPPGAMAENAARLDAVMLKPVADSAALAEVLADTRINALCLGPGMGLDARAAEVVRVALETSRLRLKAGAAQGLRLVLDADALTLISRDAGLFALLHESCVLTPHAGEFARLFPDIAEKLAASAIKGPAYSKVDATREAAARAGGVVLYKGADTVIAAPDGRCSINAAVYERSAPWLATAGSGDVLAGFITGLVARGFAPMQAAETADWLHVECASRFGPGLIAEDLPEELPKVFRALGV